MDMQAVDNERTDSADQSYMTDELYYGPTYKRGSQSQEGVSRDLTSMAASHTRKSDNNLTSTVLDTIDCQQGLDELDCQSKHDEESFSTNIDNQDKTSWDLGVIYCQPRLV